MYSAGPMEGAPEAQYTPGELLHIAVDIAPPASNELSATATSEDLSALATTYGQRMAQVETVFGTAVSWQRPETAGMVVDEGVVSALFAEDPHDKDRWLETVLDELRACARLQGVTDPDPLVHASPTLTNHLLELREKLADPEAGKAYEIAFLTFGALQEGQQIARDMLPAGHPAQTAAALPTLSSVHDYAESAPESEGSRRSSVLEEENRSIVDSFPADAPQFDESGPTDDWPVPPAAPAAPADRRAPLWAPLPPAEPAAGPAARPAVAEDPAAGPARDPIVITSASPLRPIQIPGPAAAPRQPGRIARAARMIVSGPATLAAVVGITQDNLAERVGNTFERLPRNVRIVLRAMDIGSIAAIGVGMYRAYTAGRALRDPAAHNTSLLDIRDNINNLFPDTSGSHHDAPTARDVVPVGHAAPLENPAGPDYGYYDFDRQALESDPGSPGNRASNVSDWSRQSYTYWLKDELGATDEQVAQFFRDNPTAIDDANKAFFENNPVVSTGDAMRGGLNAGDTYDTTGQNDVAWSKAIDWADAHGIAAPAEQVVPPADNPSDQLGQKDTHDNGSDKNDKHSVAGDAAVTIGLTTGVPLINAIAGWFMGRRAANTAKQDGVPQRQSNRR